MYRSMASRLARLAIAAHVGRDGVIAGLGQRLQLMAPRIPGFGKPWQNRTTRPAPGLGEMDRNPVCLDGAMDDLGHAASPCALTSIYTRSMTTSIRSLGVKPTTQRRSRRLALAMQRRCD